MSKRIVYTPEQKRVIKQMRDTTKSFRVSALAGSGKSQILSSLVLTPDRGYITMGEIKVGDKVCSPYNTINTVLAIHPQGITQVYEVHFNDGAIIECNREHLWQVTGRTYRINKTRVLTTEELMNSPLHNKGGYNFTVPLTNVKYDKKDLPIHPYLLGVLLGDASLASKSSIMLSYHLDDKEIVDRASKLLPKGTRVGASRVMSEHGSRVAFVGTEKNTTSTLRLAIDKLGLAGAKSHTKFIPKAYLQSSTEDRLDILRGIMDTDGSVGSRNRVTYSSTSLDLINGVRELCQSLGGTATIGKGKVRTKAVNHCYTLIVKFDDLNPFYLTRKAKKVTPRRRNGVRKTIVKIVETDRYEEQQCISLDGDHLYITDEFTTTHNTYTILQGIKHSKDKKFLLLSFNRHLQVEYEAKKKKMGLHNLSISTFHALATKYTVNSGKSLTILGKTFKPRRYKYIPYIHGRILKQAGYAGSAWNASMEFKDFNTSNKTLDEASTFIKKSYLEAFKKGEITHDMYVKVFLTMLVNKEINLNDAYDAVIIDEAQDLAESMYNCFTSLGVNQSIEIGDKFQSLYAFMLKDFNVFDTPSENVLTLNRSFRSSSQIAKAVQNAALTKWLDFDGVYEGNGEPDYSDKSVWYVCRTNANVLQIAMSEALKGNKIQITKSYLTELLSPVYAVRDLSFAFKDGVQSSKYAKCKTISDVRKVNDRIPTDLAHDLLEYMHEGYWQTLDITNYITSYSSLEFKRAVGISKFLERKKLTITNVKETILKHADKKALIKASTVHKAKGAEAGTAILVGFKSFADLLVEVREKVIKQINVGKLERRALQYPDSKISDNAGFAPFLEIIDVYPDALPVIEFKSEVMMVYVAITRAKHSVELSSTSSTPDWWTKELDACRRPVELLGE